MKKYIIAFFFVACISCIKDPFKATEFFLKNSCDFTIVVNSSALVRYSDGYKEENMTDIVQGGQLLSMRRIAVSENFTIKSVFTKIEIFKGTIKSNYDVMNKDNWVKTLSSDKKDEYTLTVDTTFFK